MSLGRSNAIVGGAFVAIVGPSGAGKDAVMRYAAERLADRPDIHFVRRVITRPCDGGSEIHDSIDESGFDAAEAAGGFALTWRAHGLRYGLPIAVDGLVGEGAVVVANTSRGAVAAVRRRYRDAVIVEITAAVEILARRIAARGRESGPDVGERIEAAGAVATQGDVLRFDNGGALEIAGERLIELLRSKAAKRK